MPRPDADRELRRQVKALYKSALATTKQSAFAAEWQVSPQYVSDLLANDAPLSEVWAERIKAFVEEDEARALEQKLRRLFVRELEQRKQEREGGGDVLVATAHVQQSAAALVMRVVDAAADGKLSTGEVKEIAALADKLDRVSERLVDVVDARVEE